MINVFKDQEGTSIIEVLIAIVVGGGAVYLVVNNHLIPGLREVWNGTTTFIQNSWFY